jgi:hypothetical protein
MNNFAVSLHQPYVKNGVKGIRETREMPKAEKVFSDNLLKTNYVNEDNYFITKILDSCITGLKKISNKGIVKSIVDVFR